MKALMTRASLFHVLFTALCILIVPATSEAVSTTINNVTVTVGGVTWCITGCSASPTGNSGAGAIWASAANAVITSPDTPGDHTLILTQTPNIAGNGNVFNFDTSDRDGTAIGSCSSSLPCVTVLSINGTNIPLSGGQANALANFNNDPAGMFHNEASNWNGAVFNGGPGGFIVWFGYADNAHTDACADTTGTVASNCLPDSPWQGSANTRFVGGTVNNVGGTGCDRPGVPSCFDAGAIRIEVNNAISTPEPPPLFLLVSGLIGFAALLKKRVSYKD